MHKKIYPPLLSFCFLFLLIELSVRLHWINPTLIPAPSQVLATCLEMKSEFFQATRESFFNILIGWFLSILVGSLIAFSFSLFDFLKRAILPFAIFFQTVPIIAIAPLLVIYFGFGAPTVIVSAFVVSIFPIIANTLIGLESVSAAQKELFALYKTNSWRTLYKLKIPTAYPYIYSGLKVSAGLAVIGAVAGEFVAGGGLGAVIDAARTQQRIDIVFAALFFLSAIGLSLIALLKIINYILNLYRPFGLNLRD